MAKKEKYQLESGWLNVPKVMSDVNLLAFITGGRGMGKTYGFMKYVLERAIDACDLSTLEEKTDYSTEQFMFLRRYDIEMTNVQHNLVSPLLFQEIIRDHQHKLCPELSPDVAYATIETTGGTKSIAKVWLAFRSRGVGDDDKKADKLIKRYQIGILSSVNMHFKMRGTGFPFVTTIIYDEFSSEDPNAYVKNEPRKLLDIIESVMRDRTNMKVVCLGNSGTILNPHFAFFEYTEFDEELVYKKNGSVAFFHLKNVAPYKADNSLFGDLISGTEYEEYSKNNKFADNQKFNVHPLTGVETAVYNIKIGVEGWFTIWQDNYLNIVIISRGKRDGLRNFTDLTPIDDEILYKEQYLNIARMMKYKQLYFSSPDLRLVLERYMQKYVRFEKTQWKTFER